MCWLSTENKNKSEAEEKQKNERNDTKTFHSLNLIVDLKWK